VALEYKLHRQLALMGDWFGRVGSTQYVDVNPSELDVGMRVGLPKMFTATFGGGTGINRAIGAPRFRAFLAISWAPDFRDRDADGVYDEEDQCPDSPEDMDGFRDADGCPEPDNDGDGVLDGQDKCPGEAEDLDQFQDEDGCPEADNDKDGTPDLNDPCPNAAEDGAGKKPKDGCPSTTEDGDGDGVPDATDKCNDEPEDRDGFEDYDGCPDLDNDNDGIPDNFDTCPIAAEDPDGFEDADGCPEPDNDKDGIEDARDKCPLQPETLNGNRDDDGCPDGGSEIVKLKEGRIEVRDRIGFARGGSRPTLTTGGLAVLKLVAMVLRGHQELTSVRIEVPNETASKEDAQARAQAIVDALVAQKVDAKRLKAVGREQSGGNVEFIIEQQAEPKKAPEGPATETPAPAQP
jgi:OmpA-OmpF porin, OOP family